MNWIAIVVLILVALILFALGWGIGYRRGYTDGDGVWRRASGEGYARIDSAGRLVKMTPEERKEMERALREFKKGKPSKLNS